VNGKEAAMPQAARPIDITERYKLVFDQHKHVADLRVKMIQGWCLVYVALAAAFVWVHTASKPLSWIVPIFGIVTTGLMWFADARNRSGFRAWRDIGADIENDQEAGIPMQQRFFARRLRTDFLRYGPVIDIFSLVAVGFLLYAAVYLRRTNGVLPS
jgi:hypothetical protein